jgi:hypothetical protein
MKAFDNHFRMSKIERVFDGSDVLHTSPGNMGNAFKLLKKY